MTSAVDRTPLTEPQVAGLKRLTEELRGIAGWLTPREAWELNRAAAEAAPGGSPVAVEIGSWKGRSTVAIGLGLKERGAGILHSIDPHIEADHRYHEVIANVERSGVAPYVHVIRAMSHEARTAVPEDGTVDLLFVDGAHDYESVRLDVQTWMPALRPGATVAFNDPMWPGVNQVLRETLVPKGSPFRRARLIVNSMFAEYRPAEPWTEEDQRRAQALDRLLVWGRSFVRRKKLLRRLPEVLRRPFLRGGVRRMHHLYADVDLHHFGWLDPEAGLRARDE